MLINSTRPMSVNFRLSLDTFYIKKRNISTHYNFSSLFSRDRQVQRQSTIVMRMASGSSIPGYASVVLDTRQMAIILSVLVSSYLIPAEKKNIMIGFSEFFFRKIKQKLSGPENERQSINKLGHFNPFKG